MRATPLSLLLPALLCLASACGPDEGEGLALKEGQSIGDATACFVDGTCPYVYDVCVKIKYDSFDVPARCLPNTVCERFTCTVGECRVYNGRPGEVKCVIP
jgi:hypothetical protein